MPFAVFTHHDVWVYSGFSPWIQFSRCLEGKVISKCRKEKILKENSFFWSYFATNSLEDQMVKQREHKADNDRDGIKENHCSKGLTWGLWSQKYL